MNKRKLMVVTWQDHFDRSDWHSSDQISLKPWTIQTVGWVTAEDDIAIALSTGIAEKSDRFGYTMIILKATIVDSYEIVF